MSKPLQLHTARAQLTDAVAASQFLGPDPLPISPWLAMSLMQKAIRRGHESLALRAAATLLNDSPERFWRRCGGIAYEDVGLAGLEAVSLVTAALKGKRARAEIGPEWAIASVLVAKLARAPKCRASDDLLMTAAFDPDLAAERRAFASLSLRELLSIAIGSDPLLTRAIALWYAVGTRPYSALLYRKGDAAAAFGFLKESGYDPALVEIAESGYRTLREPLCPFVVLLSDQGVKSARALHEDPMPRLAMIGDIPGWAYDLYSREGRAGLKLFLQGDAATVRWLRAHVPPAARIGVLGSLLFRVEGGLVKRRLQWPVACHLRWLADTTTHGPHCPEAGELLELLRADIGALNAVRADVR
jgi:hypothetical protein